MIGRVAHLIGAREWNVHPLVRDAVVINEGSEATPAEVLEEGNVRFLHVGHHPRPPVLACGFHRKADKLPTGPHSTRLRKDRETVALPETRLVKAIEAHRADNEGAEYGHRVDRRSVPLVAVVAREDGLLLDEDPVAHSVVPLKLRP